MGLDRKLDRIARSGQCAQRTRRAMHQIADAMHVEDHKILAVTVDRARELTDHRPCSVRRLAGRRRRLPPLQGRVVTALQLQHAAPHANAPTADPQLGYAAAAFLGGGFKQAGAAISMPCAMRSCSIRSRSERKLVKSPASAQLALPVAGSSGTP